MRVMHRNRNAVDKDECDKAEGYWHCLNDYRSYRLLPVSANDSPAYYWAAGISDFCVHDCRGMQIYKKQSAVSLHPSAIAGVCSAVTYFAERSLYQSIFTTFSCSMLLIFVLDAAAKTAERARKIFCGVCAAVLVFLYFAVFQLRMIPGFETDYGFLGIITPVLAWLGRSKVEMLSGFTIGLCLLSAELGTVQFFSLAAVILLYFYNGERGNHSLKWAFYAYYPLHIAVLYGISQIVG